jgi:hypothetical protein
MALQGSSITFDLIVKTVSTIPWTVDLNTVTLDALKATIGEDDSSPSFEFKRRDSSTCIPRTNEELRSFLRTLIATKEKPVKVSVINPANPLSTYTLSEV